MVNDDSNDLPPLSVDDDAPILNEGGEDKKSTVEKGAAADNTACFVCHANYREEILAVQHAEKKVGCVDCHGDSYPHRNDENNTTPPDIIYPKDKIVGACRKCHETHDVPAVEVIALWLKRYPEGKDVKVIVCTDCHGAHRLKIRNVRWDKKTRKLILKENQDQQEEQKKKSS